MIKLKDIVNEMPVSHHGTIGDFSKGSSFTSKADRALVTHPVAVRKIADFFKNTTVDFDFYFVNTKHARKYTELGKVKPDFIFNELQITPDQLRNGKINDGAVTVFFTNNKGSERMPLTPWVIAHRFGHVLRREYAFSDVFIPWLNSQFAELLTCYGISKQSDQFSYSSNNNSRRYYQLARRSLFEAIGTFKSARDKNLRDDFEFYYELFAQYLKDGAIKFNPLPNIIKYGGISNGGSRHSALKNAEEATDILNGVLRDYSYYAEDVLSDAVGNIYVM